MAMTHGVKNNLFVRFISEQNRKYDKNVYKPFTCTNKIMSACRNMIKDFNLRKVWKYIRTKHLNSNKRKKINSDSILMEMRTRTDMVSERAEREMRISLEYERNSRGEYQVAYKPLTFKRAIDYKRDLKSDFQQWFHDLCLHEKSSSTIDLSVLECNQTAKNQIALN